MLSPCRQPRSAVGPPPASSPQKPGRARIHAPATIQGPLATAIDFLESRSLSAQVPVAILLVSRTEVSFAIQTPLHAEDEQFRNVDTARPATHPHWDWTALVAAAWFGLEVNRPAPGEGKALFSLLVPLFLSPSQTCRPRRVRLDAGAARVENMPSRYQAL